MSETVSSIHKLGYMVRIAVCVKWDMVQVIAFRWSMYEPQSVSG